MKLQKIGVKLDDNGDLDLSEVVSDNEKKYIMKHQAVAKLTLMQSDLEFEYPQKIEKM